VPIGVLVGRRGKTEFGSGLASGHPRLSVLGENAAGLTRGAGPNIPDAGVGWSRFFELDVTQHSQAALKAALSYLATVETPGQLWHTPNGFGSGFYWDQVSGGRRCMVSRVGDGDQFPLGGNNYRGFGQFTSGVGYPRVYVHAIMSFSASLQWPANALKMWMHDPGNTSPNVEIVSGFPRRFVLANIEVTGGSSQYVTDSLHGPAAADTWVRVEQEFVHNASGSSFDGAWDAWVDGTRAMPVSGQGSGPNSVTRPANIRYTTSPGFTTLKFGPYYGGNQLVNVSPGFDVRYATFSLWVKS
jgi:hypothetical protein